MGLRLKKRGQVSVFVILAIVLVAMVAGYFLIVDSSGEEKISPEFEPVYSEFSYCLEEVVSEGDLILKAHGGVIDVPIIENPSIMYPSSNKLEYGGIEIPYWFYYSASGLPKSNVPSRSKMEDELKYYLNKKWASCVREVSNSEMEVSVSEPENIEVEIRDKEIRAEIISDFSISNGEDSSLIRDHFVEVDSSIGELFNSAKVVFDEEMNESLIGDYSMDVLRLYTPVDGVEFSCSPLTWNANDVFSELMMGLEQNFMMLNNYGDNKDYFNLDSSISENVNVVYSPNWPGFFEVDPSQDALMVSQPIGNQEGLGVLGFCYVPYHFVYNVRVPVLIQVSEGEESFQFPYVLSIEKNSLKEVEIDEDLNYYEDVCSNEGEVSKISVYDLDLNPLDDAKVYYDCLGQSCYLGETDNEGVYEGALPSCINGVLRVNSDGYKESSMVYSSNAEGSVSFVLNKFYIQEVDLFVGSQEYFKEAVINFYSEDYSANLHYPSNKRVSIPEGEYEISVYIYGNSSFDLPGVTTQCFDVPRSGFGGLIGLTSEECIDVEVSEDFSSKVLVGGGKTNYFFSEEDLKNSNSIVLEMDELFKTENFEDLQRNYNIVEQKEFEVSLR